MARTGVPAGSRDSGPRDRSRSTGSPGCLGDYARARARFVENGGGIWGSHLPLANKEQGVRGGAAGSQSLHTLFFCLRDLEHTDRGHPHLLLEPVSIAGGEQNHERSIMYNTRVLRIYKIVIGGGVCIIIYVI